MEKQIKLDEKSAQEFVSAASRCNFDIDVFYNRIIIDAKSILGLLSLDLTKTLTVKCYGEDEDFNRVPVSYTHLDVYKRQTFIWMYSVSFP